MPRVEIVPGLLVINGPQNAGEAFERWKNDRKTGFNDIVHDLALQIGDNLLHDRTTQVALAAFMIATTGALIYRLSNRKPETVTALSFGENPNKYITGTLPAEAVLRIVEARERLCAPQPGSLGILERGMAVINRIVPEEIERIQEFFYGLNSEGLHAYISNVNTATQVVASGIKPHIKEAFRRYLDQRHIEGLEEPTLVDLRRIKEAFHSPLMQEKEQKLGEQIEDITGGLFQEPEIDEYSTMLVARTGDGKVLDSLTARLAMKGQLTTPVHGRKGLHELFTSGRYQVVAISDPSGVTEGIVGGNLAELGLMNKIAVVNYSTPEKLEAAAAKIEECCL